MGERRRRSARHRRTRTLMHAGGALLLGKEALPLLLGLAEIVVGVSRPSRSQLGLPIAIRRK